MAQLETQSDSSKANMAFAKLPVSERMELSALLSLRKLRLQRPKPPAGLA